MRTVLGDALVQAQASELQALLPQPRRDQEQVQSRLELSSRDREEQQESSQTRPAGLVAYINLHHLYITGDAILRNSVQVREGKAA